MNGFLVHYDATGSTGRKLHLKGRRVVSFGSDSQCTVVLRTQGFKPKHALMNVQDDKIYLQNLDEDGRMVLVNDQPLSGEPVEIRHGDKINFENCVVLVYETDPQAEPVVPANGTEHADEANGDEAGAEGEEDDEVGDDAVEDEGEEEEGEDAKEDEEGEEESPEESESKEASDGMETETEARGKKRKGADALGTDEADDESRVDSVSVALKLPENTSDASKGTPEEGSTPQEEDNSRFKHVTLDRLLTEGLVGEGSSGSVEIVKDSTGALCFLLRFPNALKHEKARELLAGLPEMPPAIEEARKNARKRAAPPAKRIKQEAPRTGPATATRLSTRAGTLSRPAGARSTNQTGARVLPPNKRLTATSARAEQPNRGMNVAPGPTTRQRVIVGKKKAAAAALNAHRAEEAAVNEAELEGDDNYEEDGEKKKKKKNKSKGGNSKKGAKKQHISAKGTLLWSAEKVLRDEKKPMKASEIIAKGREKGYIETDSKGAANSLVGRFSTSIRQDPNSPFIRVASATYGIKDYANLSSYKNFVETSSEQ